MTPTQRDSELIVEIARTFTAMMQEHFPGWSRAFFRFYADEAMTEGKGSFERNGEVEIFDVIHLRAAFHRMNDTARELRRGNVSFRVMLLKITSDFDYQVDFERQDRERWTISKLNGRSGLPSGID